MKCLCCGGNALVAGTRTLNGVPDVTGDYCPDCGEVILNREHGDRYAAALQLSKLGDANADIQPKHTAPV